MKQSRFGLAAVIVLALLVSVGCSKSTGPDNKSGINQLKMGNATYSLAKLYFDDYGQSSTGVYNIDLIIVSAGLDLAAESGSGDGIYLEMFFPTSSVTAGTYTFSDDWPMAAGKFSDDSGIFSGFQFSPYTPGDWLNATGGTVTIAISGTTYTINGTLQLEGGATATFNYTGPLTGSF